MIPIPLQIGKYRVSGLIGRGGMGAVYRGTDPLLDREVAIKVLHDLTLAEGEVQRRFLQEARAAASLRHENIVTIYEVGEQGGFTYVAMEYVSGETLAAMVRGGTRLPLGDVLGWIDQLCSALSLAHARGVVHRDVKPANLMVDEHGALRILDFGIARLEGSTMTAAGDMIGTLNYMSPEQVLGQPVDLRSDIFAVGATAYELLTGRQAFPGGAAATLQRILNVDPPPPSSIHVDLPPELDDVIGRALAKDPAHRFGDLREMQRRIRAVRARLDAVAENPPMPTAPPPVAIEPTRLVTRPTSATVVGQADGNEPAPVTPPHVADPTVVVNRPPATPADGPAAPEPDVARRWSPMWTIGVVSTAGGLLLAGLISWSWRDVGPPRPANDLAVLIERSIAPHFSEEIRQDVEQRFGPLDTGLRVETTLDPVLQEAAHAAVVGGVRLNDLEGALVALDHRTGQIRALVGGSTRDVLNRARARRRIGSLFMPVLFTAAIDRGFTPISILIDEPAEFTFSDGPPYRPHNDDGTFRGPITLRQALEGARIVTAAKMLFNLGAPAVVGYARRLGLDVEFPPERLLVAGELDATLVEMTSVYATIANQGIHMAPQGIVAVTDDEGKVIERYPPQPTEGIRADTAFMITSLLNGVIERGTAASARTLDWTLAGMTGTVENNTDAWFVGFDPTMTVGVWVGRDDVSPIGSREVASSTALSIWTEFMRAYIAARGDRSNPPGFNTPANIVLRSVAGAIEPFIAGTEP